MKRKMKRNLDASPASCLVSFSFQFTLNLNFVWKQVSSSEYLTPPWIGIPDVYTLFGTSGLNFKYPSYKWKWTKEKDLTLNTQVKHESGQKKKILTLNTQVKHESGQKKKILTLNTKVKHESGQKKKI